MSLTASMLNSVLTPEQSTIVLIETMAGKGTEIDGTFENIRSIIDGVELPDKIFISSILLWIRLPQSYSFANYENFYYFLKLILNLENFFNL